MVNLVLECLVGAHDQIRVRLLFLSADARALAVFKESVLWTGHIPAHLDDLRLRYVVNVHPKIPNLGPLLTEILYFLILIVILFILGIIDYGRWKVIKKLLRRLKDFFDIVRNAGPSFCNNCADSIVVFLPFVTFCSIYVNV